MRGSRRYPTPRGKGSCRGPDKLETLIGESGSIGAPPTIVHAVLDALAPFDIDNLDVPMMPLKVWTAIGGAARQACKRRTARVARGRSPALRRVVPRPLPRISAFFGNGAINMTSPRSVVFANPARTAIGTFGGSLKEIAAPNLGAGAIKAAIERAGLKPDEVGTVAMGNVIQAGAKVNPARQAAIHGGLPVSVPAMTVNRVCGSGAPAIVSPAAEIILGSVDVPVARGMEDIGLAAYLLARGRWGHRMGDGQLYDSMLRDGLNDAFSDEHSGWHTEDLAEKFQIGRPAQDEWALRSQQRFSAAQEAGRIKDEIA